MYQNSFACAECGGRVPSPAEQCPRCGAPSIVYPIDAFAAAPTPWCCLTEHDVRLLEQAAAINGGADSPIGRAVAEKIRGSVVELRNEVPPDYVTLNSRVVFRVNGGDPLSRVLVHWDMFFVPGLDLSLATPWGITLLGLKVGHEAAAYWRDGTAERIVVESIPYRPATARRIGKAPSRQALASAEARVARPQRPRPYGVAAASGPRFGVDAGPGPTAA